MKKSKLASLELDSRLLRICGCVLLGAGCIGVLIQQRVLGVGRVSVNELMTLISELPHGMAFATFAIICQILELCAVPIFAFLLTEGVRHSTSYWKYLLRVLGLALICEIPYNLFTEGAVLAVGTMNPVFGAAVTLGMLWFFQSFREKKLSHWLIKLIALVGAFVWCNFLGIYCGAACTLIAAALWISGGKPNLRLLIGGAASVACAVLSPLFIFTPLSFLFIHLYNGKREAEQRRVFYLVYPVLLLVFCLITRLT